MRLFSRPRPPQLNRPVSVDFRTDTAAHGQRAIGVGVYEGTIPPQVETLLFDGAPVNFRNAETVDKVFKAAQGIEFLKRRGTLASCYVFAALFRGAVQLEEVPKGAKLWYDFTIDDEPVKPMDIADGQTLAIGAQFHDMDRPIIYHSLVAAETDESMMFFHVLGDKGPLALSGLEQALRVFKSTHIRNFSDFRVVG